MIYKDTSRLYGLAIAVLFVLILPGTITMSRAQDDRRVKMSGKTKSYKGALEFLPNGHLADGYDRVKSPFPMETDPMADPKTWYGEDNARVSGMMEDAVLFFEWWVTGEEPVERYMFNWKSSGYFAVSYVDKDGATVYKKIYRSELAKYPNLVKRFDNIRPIALSFEFNFRFGGWSDQEYWDFRKRWGINEDLGSAGYTVSYTRELDAAFVLYKRSGAQQVWTTPGMLPGGWTQFLNFPDKLQSKRKALMEIIRKGKMVVFNSHKITKIKWPVNDIIYIAKKFKDYEEGKDKPTAFDSVASAEPEKKAGDGFWDEADGIDGETESFYDKDKRKYGIRTKKGRIVKEPEFDRIEKSKTEKYYIAVQGNTVYILSNLGAVVTTKGCNTAPYIGSCNNGRLYATESQSKKVTGYIYHVDYGDTHYFKGGKFENTEKWYDVVKELALTVYSTSDKRTAAQKAADEKRADEEFRQALNGVVSPIKSAGYNTERSRYSSACN